MLIRADYVKSYIWCSCEQLNLHWTKIQQEFTNEWLIICRGVVVPERGGTPFRQMFLRQNSAPVNTVYHSRNADTAAHTVTRSQAVARIADRTAKIVTVTWPRPRLLSGKLSMRLLGIAHTKPCIKFEVSSSSRFKDIFDRMPKL